MIYGEETRRRSLRWLKTVLLKLVTCWFSSRGRSREKEDRRDPEWEESSKPRSQLAGLQTAKGQSEDRRAGLEERGWECRQRSGGGGVSGERESAVWKEERKDGQKHWAVRIWEDIRDEMNKHVCHRHGQDSYDLQWMRHMATLKGNATEFTLQSLFTGLGEYYCICGKYVA